MKVNLPNNVNAHELKFENKQGNFEEATIYTIPCDNYEKMIGFASGSRSWVHKDYKVESKKSKKKA